MNTMSGSIDDNIFDYSILVEMSRMINTFMLTDELLEFSLEVFMECSGHSRGLMFVYDKEHEELYARAIRMWDLVNQLCLKRIVDDKLNYLKLQANTHLLERLDYSSIEIIDISSNKHSCFSESFPALSSVLEMYQMTSILPLIHQRQFKGLVAMGQPVANSSFSDKKDRQLLLSLADLTATCLENIGLRETAVIDSLTRVYTNRYFRDRVDQEIERATYLGQVFSLLMLDIDKFKIINDRFGHLAGDKVLKRVAEVLRQNIRQKLDFAGRFGGDEFVLFLFGASIEVAVSIADRIKKDISEMNFPEIVNVTSSIGVATFPSHGKNFEELLSAADKGMYKSKDAGGNHVATVGDIYGDNKDKAGSKDYALFIKDRVTEFYVGEYFYNRLEEELERSRRYKHSCSLVAITIDRYHALRSMVSRRDLDKILSLFSGAVLAVMRKGVDFPARYLNDMVIFVLPETSQKGGRYFISRVAERLGKHSFPVIEKFGPIKFNFAVATYPNDADKAASLMQKLLELAAEADKKGNASCAWFESGSDLQPGLFTMAKVKVSEIGMVIG